MTTPHVLLRPDDDPRFEPRLQLASRFTALVRSGRAYSVEHASFVQLLEFYLALLEDHFATEPRVRLHAADGDACVNGERLPYRVIMERSLAQLVQEFEARGIDGVEFEAGLTLDELQRFMAHFLPGETWKGDALVEACAQAGLEHARVLPPDDPLAGETLEEAERVLPVTLDEAPEPWATLLRGARELVGGSPLERGIELRHVRRRVQPVVDAVRAGGRTVAALAHMEHGESAAEHAAHAALTAIGIAHRLGLKRAEIADLGVAALLHDAGHHGARDHGGGAGHELQGVLRLLWSTTLSPASLRIGRTALQHHDDDARTTLFGQVVSIADAYVTLLSRNDEDERWVSPSGALARVLGPFRSRWHPALPVALVRALGLYPPGQCVQLDDGSIARAIAPDPNDPARPWIERIVDARGLPVAAERRAAVPLPSHRHVVRALPRHEWPGDREGRMVA
jgi:hypothetical protein